MRYGVPVAVLAAVLLAGGCSDDPEPLPPRADATPTADPSYDAALEPAAAVLALVPEGTSALSVTDFEQVRLELGLAELGKDATAAARGAFWQRAEAERPMLTTGMLRPVDERLAAEHGFTQLDVDWEAHLFDAEGSEVGWVLAFRDGTDMSAVQGAVDAGVGPLAGADVDATERLVSSGTTADPNQSWAADEATVSMVGLPANATYVARDCIPQDAPAEVDQLGTWSLQFEGSLVTARLGEGRQDLFRRMRLGGDAAGFAEAYDGGVADPSTGRIGYVMADPPSAARLALEHRLPFAACG